MFINIKVAKIFSEINDGDFGIDIIKRAGFSEHYTYVKLQYFEKIGLITKERIEKKRRSRNFICSGKGKTKLIFLTEEGKTVQKLLDKLNVLTEKKC